MSFCTKLRHGDVGLLKAVEQGVWFRGKRYVSVAPAFFYHLPQILRHFWKGMPQ